MKMGNEVTPNEIAADITSEAADRIAAGQREYYRIHKLVNDLKDKVTELEKKCHLLSLDKMDLEKQILRAHEERDIALGLKDEAITKAAALTAILGMVAQTVNGFDAPKITAKEQPKDANGWGTKAVENALIVQRKEMENAK